jgi:hypothetical protein
MGNSKKDMKRKRNSCTFQQGLATEILDYFTVHPQHPVPRKLQAPNSVVRQLDYIAAISKREDSNFSYLAMIKWRLSP